MKKPQLLLIFAVGFLHLSCQQVSIFDTAGERDIVQKAFDLRQKSLPAVSVAVGSSLSGEMKEALQFLYTYMPLADVMDYSPAFYRMNVEYSMLAGRKVEWDVKVPTGIFRHFVLPVRVSNEPLDESRMIFTEMLRNRVVDLGMQEAIIEVNNWCGEHFRVGNSCIPSDMPAKSPLTSLKTAEGSSRDASVLLVAALRSVGIPARMVSSKGWSHTCDGDFFWVEAWANGEWFFLEACEPTAVLNNLSSADSFNNTLVVKSMVFGNYSGPGPASTPFRRTQKMESDNQRDSKNNAGFTELFVTGNYTGTDDLKVKIVDAAGKAINDARVELKIYNKADLSAVATAYSDSMGYVSFNAGKGDVIVWATDGLRFGCEKAGIGTNEEIQVVVNQQPVDRKAIAFELNYPQKSLMTSGMSQTQQAETSHRKAVSDSIRTIYTSEFPDEVQAESLLATQGYDSTLVPVIVASRGNFNQLLLFLKNVSVEDRAIAVRLLQLLPRSELNTVSSSMLRDHLQMAIPYRYHNGKENPWFDYVLNPLVDTEKLSLYRSVLVEELGDALAAAFRTAPASLVEWCAREIKDLNEESWAGVICSPLGVLKAKVGDRLSREVFFVSLARSLGIPAWRNKTDGRVYYVDFSINKDKGEVVEAVLSTDIPAAAPQGRLVLRYYRTPTIDDPQYGTHFTISKYSFGSYKLLDYDRTKVSWSNTFAWSSAPLDIGDYMLTTGTRLEDGKVLTHHTFFTIRQYWTTYVPLLIREKPASPPASTILKK